MPNARMNQYALTCPAHSQFSLGKPYYYLSLIDDETRFAWVRFLREKSDAIKFIKDFIKERKTQAQKLSFAAERTVAASISTKNLENS